MAGDKEIKRYEPYGFLLVLAMVSMLGVMLYGLYKFRRNLRAGNLVAPVPDVQVYAGLGLLALAFGFLWLAGRFLRNQAFAAFRGCLAGSFAGTVFFVVLQVARLPMPAVNAGPAQQGYYYLGFLSGVHLLFVLIGLVANALLLARAFRAHEYVEAFIFSVNPPNLLNLKLLARYTGFVALLWGMVIFFLGVHVA